MYTLQGRQNQAFRNWCRQKVLVSCPLTLNSDDPAILYRVVQEWTTRGNRERYTRHAVYIPLGIITNNMYEHLPHGPQADFVRQIRVEVQKGDKQETGERVHGYAVSVHA